MTDSYYKLWSNQGGWEGEKVEICFNQFFSFQIATTKS